MQIKATTLQNRTVTGLVGGQYETRCSQPLEKGDAESSDSSCYKLCNGEAVGHPWCSKLDVYTSTRLDVVAVSMSSEGPDAYALLGVIKDATLWDNGA